MRFVLAITVVFSAWVSAAVPAASQDFSKGIAALGQNDFPTAARELKPFAISGEVDAQFALGWMYLHGAINTEIATNAIEATYWFRQAAERGDHQSQLMLARIYENGDGEIKVDLPKAKYWYELAAEQGNTEAQFRLSMMYLKGNAVEQDFVKAAEWLRHAADQGDARAQTFLGTMFIEGDGVPKDNSKAAYFFKRAAEQGYPRAQIILASMYVDGKGVAQDFSQAFRLFLAATQHLEPMAEFGLALLHGDGFGVPKDPELSIRWLRSAAGSDLAIAQEKLGRAYFDGFGTPKNNVHAYVWLSEAARKGNKEAIKYKEKVYELLRRDYRQLKKAREILDTCRRTYYEDCKDPEPIGLRPIPRPISTYKDEPSNDPFIQGSWSDQWRKFSSTPTHLPSGLIQTGNKPKGKELKFIGTGSGFAINNEGFALTNEHVVKDCEIVTIHLPSGLKDATVIAISEADDLALLRADIAGNEVLPISYRNASLLDDIIVAGYPFSESLSASVKVTKGVVSSLAGIKNDYSQIQFDAAIQPGNSGGPILNEKGNVVAVATAGLNKEHFLESRGTIPENTNFGVKASVARAFLEANEVALPEPHAEVIQKSEMVNLITKATLLIGCWQGRLTQQAALEKEATLPVSPQMRQQIQAIQAGQ